jgi:hypothetical protein
MLVVVAVLIGMIVLIVIACKNVEEYYKENEELAWYGYPFYWIFNIVKWPFKAIWSILKFFFSYFSAVKDNYCPGIIWEEEQLGKK